MTDYTGTSGNDLFEPTSIVGGALFDGLAGQDTLDGLSLGSDYLFDLENEVVRTIGGAIAGTVRNFEEILAGNGDDILWGGSAPVVYNLNGGEGDDTIGPGSTGIANGDVFDGGSGPNTLDLSRGEDGYIANLRTDTLQQGRSQATVQNFISVIGSDHDDYIRDGSGYSNAPKELNGGRGDDTIAISIIVNLGHVYDGSHGIDRLELQNSSLNWEINFENDRIEAHRSGDEFFFGIATILNFESAIAGGWNDTIIGDASDETLRGGDGNDSIEGNQGRDVLAGNDGQDTLLGGDGDDRLFGGTGEDRLNGGNDQDEIWGGYGEDSVMGRAGEDTLRGGDQNDRLYGGTGDDEVAGNAGDDSVEGGSDNDSLFGGSGADTLIGGAGADQLSGGQHADVFLFREISDSPHGDGRDTITDFVHNVDLIDLSGIPGSLTFVPYYTGWLGEVRYNEVIGRLYVDIDGDRASDFSIDIEGAPIIDAGDLIL